MTRPPTIERFLTAPLTGARRSLGFWAYLPATRANGTSTVVLGRGATAVEADAEAAEAAATAASYLLE